VPRAGDDLRRAWVGQAAGNVDASDQHDSKRSASQVIRCTKSAAVSISETNIARVIVVEFPSYEVAKACCEDPAYQKAKEFALKTAKRDLVIIERDSA